MKTFSFAEGQWENEPLQRVYTFRFTETPDFTQHADCIGGGVNASHKEGFDNISLLTKETYGVGVKAQLRCAFEGAGCPEIIFVEKLENCADGAVRYGACFEIVLYRNGLNIWRHYREDGRCFWYKRLGWEFPVSENEIHDVRAEVRENYLTVEVDGKRMTLRVEDMFDSFHVGLTVCEGIARAYELSVGE